MIFMSQTKLEGSLQELPGILIGIGIVQLVTSFGAIRGILKEMSNLLLSCVIMNAIVIFMQGLVGIFIFDGSASDSTPASVISAEQCLLAFLLSMKLRLLFAWNADPLVAASDPKGYNAKRIQRFRRGLGGLGVFIWLAALASVATILASTGPSSAAGASVATQLHM